MKRVIPAEAVEAGVQVMYGNSEALEAGTPDQQADVREVLVACAPYIRAANAWDGAK